MDKEKMTWMDYGIVLVFTLILIGFCAIMGNFVPTEYQQLYWFSIIFGTIIISHPDLILK